MIVTLEPWAEEFRVSPGSTLSVNIYYDNPGVLETDIGPRYFTLWLWGGCRAEVSLDGSDLTPNSLTIPAPI